MFGDASEDIGELACGSMSLSLAVPIRETMKATLSPLRPGPTISHGLLSRAKPSERLSDVFAKPGERHRSLAIARRSAVNQNLLREADVWEWPFRRLLAGVSFDPGSVGLNLFEYELHLIRKLGRNFSAGPKR